MFVEFIAIVAVLVPAGVAIWWVAGLIDPGPPFIPTSTQPLYTYESHPASPRPEFRYSFVDQPVKVGKGSTASAGYDLSTIDDVTIDPTGLTMAGTGVKVEIPEGYVGLLFPRSSTYKKYGVYLANSVGVIDADYRGEIKLALKGDRWVTIQKGERLAQLVVIPHILGAYSKELSDTVRGDGGFGSTG